MLSVAMAEIDADLAAALERLHVRIHLTIGSRAGETVGSSVCELSHEVFRAADLDGAPRVVLVRPQDAAVWLGFLLDGQGGAKSEERSERDNFHHFLLNGLHSAKIFALLNGSFQSLNALFSLYFI